jgi:hypothetical protein
MSCSMQTALSPNGMKFEVYCVHCLHGRDITYVGVGQMAVIANLEPGPMSDRAKAALERRRS